jgi:hypothetical protein
MSDPVIERQTMETDIVCVGFGPATAGFLSTLSRHILNPDGTPAVESPSMPGMPLQVMCYERADDVGFGVSGVVTRARGIRATLPDAKLPRDPHGDAGHAEKVVYLLDPSGRQPPLGSRCARPTGWFARSACIATTPWSCPMPAVPAQARRLVYVAGPVSAARGQRADGGGHGAGVAGHAGGRGAAR